MHPRQLDQLADTVIHIPHTDTHVKHSTGRCTPPQRTPRTPLAPTAGDRTCTGSLCNCLYPHQWHLYSRTGISPSSHPMGSSCRVLALSPLEPLPCPLPLPIPLSARGFIPYSPPPLVAALSPQCALVIPPALSRSVLQRVRYFALCLEYGAPFPQSLALPPIRSPPIRPPPSVLALPPQYLPFPPLSTCPSLPQYLPSQS